MDIERNDHGTTATATNTTTATISTLSRKEEMLLIQQRLLEWFQGDFDNYHQVVEDRAQNLLPREGGGHEHFHCTLVPLNINSNSRLAAFYFDGNPDRIFRFRHYQLLWNKNGTTNGESVIDFCEDNDNNDDDELVVEMHLSTLHPELEAKLRTHSSDPTSWPRLFHDFQFNDTSHSPSKIELLPNCEIVWSLQKDPIQHAYTNHFPENSKSAIEPPSIHAVMVHGQAIVNSTIVPGMSIRILDQLSLYEHVFYINDRGFHPWTNAYIYGNQRGVPYRLERVTKFVEVNENENDNIDKCLVSKNIQREICCNNPSLQWTLGPSYRTKEEYEMKMNAIGGVSGGIHKRSYQKATSTTLE